jgi:hypothetical protein
MLTRTGPYNETALVDAARGYLHLYADGKVPYLDEGVQAFVVFVYVVNESMGVRGGGEVSFSVSPVALAGFFCALQFSRQISTSNAISIFFIISHSFVSKSNLLFYPV